MERFTQRAENGNVFYPHCFEECQGMAETEKCISCDYYDRLLKRFADYEDAEEQGLLLRLDSKDELIEVLATKLLNSEFGNCYMCKNSMKNITLDGINNGCDGQCDTLKEYTVDDFLKKIVRELEYMKYKKQKEAEQALKQMGE